MPPARAPFTLGLALAAAVLLLPSAAFAEPPALPYQLSYSAPPGCPTEARVLAEVRANVHDAASADGASIALTIVQNDEVFTGELVALDRSGKQGRRSIQGPSCVEVSQTLAFLAALAIELGGHVEEEPAPAPAPAPAPQPRKTVPQPAAKPVSPPPPSGWKLGLLLGGGVRGALAPALRPAAEAGLDFGVARATTWAPAVRATVVGALSRISRSEGDAKLSLLAARLEGCPLRFGPRVIALRPCLGVELGAVWARGELEGGRSVVQRWGSSEVELHLETSIAPEVFLELSGAAAVPFFHTRYFFVPQRVIYSVPAATGRASLAAGVRFQ